MKFYTISEKGRRESNQDYISVVELAPDCSLFLLADGMGGYEMGDVAAKAINKSIAEYFEGKRWENYETTIQEAVIGANELIRSISCRECKKLGATIAGVIVTQKRAICFWIGDVKIYHFSGNRLTFESSAHSLMNEILKNGAIKDVQNAVKYRHIVTRSIQGENDSIDVDFHVISDLKEDDQILLCSDGVHDVLSGVHLLQISKSKGSQEMLQEISLRCSIDSVDNYSAILIHY